MIEIKIELEDMDSQRLWRHGKTFFLKERHDKIDRLDVIKEVEKYLEETL